MPSTDRWLWLLQMALFLALPIYVLLGVMGFGMTADPVDCGTWHFTDPSGYEYRLRAESCPGTETNASGFFLVLILWWLAFSALGAIIFCLRRIGRSLGAR